MNPEEFDQYVLHTYNREKVSFIKGKGCYLYDQDNHQWLDMISGIGVTNLGHSHPKLVKTLIRQAKLLWHTSNIYYINQQGESAKKISKLAFKGKTFFCNSGAEANESALKLCKKWGKSQASNKNIILSLNHSFHGRTVGALSLTGQEIYQKNFTPLLENINYIKPNDINDLEDKMNDCVCGLFIEVIQGEGGVLPLSPDFVERARELTIKHQSLLIIDEVQTGIGRTAKPFGFQNYNITPDAITLAKGLGNGLPIGALHVNDNYKSVLAPGDHASTYGGNFLVTAVANDILSIIGDESFLKEVVFKSDYLKNSLLDIKNNFPEKISEIRGLGLMWGIVTKKAGKLYKELYNRKILTTNIKNKVIRILPPLIINQKQIDYFLKQLIEAIENL